MKGKLQQISELNKMRQQAKKLQKELEQIIQTAESGDVRVKVSGDQKIEYLEVDGEERNDIKDLVNKAFKNVQKKSAKKMMEMGGGLSGLLGN